MDSFNSVNDFLKAARSAKQQTESLISEELSPMLDDKHTVAVTPELFTLIDELQNLYGDETLRAIIMFCIGKWINVHRERLEDYLHLGNVGAGLWVMNDLSKLHLFLSSLDEIRSFDGDEEWRKMIKEVVSKAVMETCEERGISFQQLFKKD